MNLIMKLIKTSNIFVIILNSFFIQVKLNNHKIKYPLLI